MNLPRLHNFMSRLQQAQSQAIKSGDRNAIQQLHRVMQDANKTAEGAVQAARKPQNQPGPPIPLPDPRPDPNARPSLSGSAPQSYGSSAATAQEKGKKQAYLDELANKPVPSDLARDAKNETSPTWYDMLMNTGRKTAEFSRDSVNGAKDAIASTTTPKGVDVGGELLNSALRGVIPIPGVGEMSGADRLKDLKGNGDWLTGGAISKLFPEKDKSGIGETDYAKEADAYRRERYAAGDTSAYDPEWAKGAGGAGAEEKLLEWGKQGEQPDTTPTPQAQGEGWGWGDFLGLLLGGRNYLKYKAGREDASLARQDRKDYQKTIVSGRLAQGNNSLEKQKRDLEYKREHDTLVDEQKQSAQDMATLRTLLGIPANDIVGNASKDPLVNQMRQRYLGKQNK